MTQGIKSRLKRLEGAGSGVRVEFAPPGADLKALQEKLEREYGGPVVVISAEDAKL